MLGKEIISNPNEISVFDEAMKNIEIESLKKAIETLNKKERIIIDLLFFKFLNEIEVAKILKMSNQNVNYLKKKILKKLYKILKEKI